LRQILIAGAFALIFSLFGTRVLIRALASKGYGQIIRDDGPSSHHIKHGTPTMGGIIFILAAIAGYLVAPKLSWLTRPFQTFGASDFSWNLRISRVAVC